MVDVASEAMLSMHCLALPTFFMWRKSGWAWYLLHANALNIIA